MSQVEIYNKNDGEDVIEVKFDNDTVWLNQNQLTELFNRDRTVMSKHINNIFRKGELDKKRNVQKMHIPFSDKSVSYYNLDVVISLGYRVKSNANLINDR